MSFFALAICAIAIGAMTYFMGWLARSRTPGFNQALPKQKGPPSVSPAAAEAAAPSGPTVLILFGSQTGTAEMFAKTLHREAGLLGVPSKLQDIEDFAPHQLEDEAMVIFVLATYGEGEPTDSAKSFHDYLMDDSRALGSELTKVKFAVFALGDKQYKLFCQEGVEIDSRMKSLGAKRVYGLGQGDSGSNIEEEFDRWRKDLWPAVAHSLKLKLREESDEPYNCELKLKYVEATAASRDPFPKVASAVEPTQRLPVYGVVAENTELLRGAAVADRSVRHIVLDISDTLISYQAGDHLGVLPRNRPELVESYLTHLKIDSVEASKIITLQDKKFKNVFPARVSIRDVLTWYVDLAGVPKKSSLRAFAHCCSDPKEKADLLGALQVTPEGQAKYHDLVASCRNTLGFIEHYPSCVVPINLFLEVMPRMTPRYFSISSDQLAQPKQIFITVALVEGGVCTSMLAEAAVGTRIPIFVRKSTFHLPLRDKKRPIIMIGPGTGVAPLVGFLHRRRVWQEKNNELGEAMLFFGCRNQKDDYLYEEFINKAIGDKIITELHVAFSRDQPEKIYVQHMLQRQADSVWRLLDEGKANVYICGDAKYMAKDVDKVLLEIIQSKGGMSLDAAKQYITKLEKGDRFLKDVWSA
eukprot:GILI01007579.1.p1 GENE.GILI01007579.1~~GILI01007579.1.p1  ORF type:complete len:640 (-),score=167.06 GILI01007579.1:308-2227(-)